LRGTFQLLNLINNLFSSAFKTEKKRILETSKQAIVEKIQTLQERISQSAPGFTLGVIDSGPIKDIQLVLRINSTLGRNLRKDGISIPNDMTSLTSDQFEAIVGKKLEIFFYFSFLILFSV
jgi:hypothetical protein